MSLTRRAFGALAASSLAAPALAQHNHRRASSSG